MNDRLLPIGTSHLYDLSVLRNDKAEQPEYVYVRIDLSRSQRTAFRVAPDSRKAESREQRWNQHYGRTHIFGKNLTLRIKSNAFMMEPQCIGDRIEIHHTTKLPEYQQNLLDIGNVGHVA